MDGVKRTEKQAYFHVFQFAVKLLIKCVVNNCGKGEAYAN